MDYLPLVVPFVDSLNLKTQRAKQDYAKHLRASIDFINSKGLDVNNEDTFSALYEYLLHSFKESTAKNRLSLTRKFFALINSHKGGDFMTMPRNIPLPLEAQQPNYMAANDTQLLDDTQNTEEEKRKPGRPIKGKEERDKKITVNIPGSIWTAIQDISRIDGVTFPDTVNAFLEQAVNARYEDIEALRQIRAKRH